MSCSARRTRTSCAGISSARLALVFPCISWWDTGLVLTQHSTPHALSRSDSSLNTAVKKYFCQAEGHRTTPHAAQWHGCAACASAETYLPGTCQQAKSLLGGVFCHLLSTPYASAPLALNADVAAAQHMRMWAACSGQAQVCHRHMPLQRHCDTAQRSKAARTSLRWQWPCRQAGSPLAPPTIPSARSATGCR